MRPLYRATADVDVAAASVTGTLAVTFTPDISTDELLFRLWPNAPVLEASGVRETVGAVTRADGTALPVDQPDPTTLHVELPEPLVPGASVAVTMSFELRVPNGNDDRVARDRDSMRLGSFLPLLAWEPGFGWATDPATSVHGEAATSPVADYDVAITVPDGYDVLGTGVRGDDGHWRASAVRDVGFAVGHFTVADDDVGGVHVVVGVAAGTGEDPARYLRPIADALDHYRSRLSSYPWPTYTAAVLPGFSGGIEFPTFVMEGPGSALRSIVHELAHQWFYSLVGNDQGRDPWLDEGLASYVEFVEVGSLGRHLRDVVPADARGRAGDPMTYWENHQASYYAAVYVQPAVAVARLGSVDEVDCALRGYVARRAFTIARPADFIDSLAAAFGDAPNRLAAYGLHS